MSRPTAGVAVGGESVQIRDWDAEHEHAAEHEHEPARAPSVTSPRVGDSPEDWAIFDVLVRESASALDQEEEEEEKRTEKRGTCESEDRAATQQHWDDTVHLLVSGGGGGGGSGGGEPGSIGFPERNLSVGVETISFSCRSLQRSLRLMFSAVVESWFES